MEQNLKAAWFVYGQEVDRMRDLFMLAQHDLSPAQIQKVAQLDYFKLLGKEEISTTVSEVVKRALGEKRGFGGTRIIKKEESCCCWRRSCGYTGHADTLRSWS
jgi:hypothetical protein